MLSRWKRIDDPKDLELHFSRDDKKLQNMDCCLQLIYGYDQRVVDARDLHDRRAVIPECNSLIFICMLYHTYGR